MIKTIIFDLGRVIVPFDFERGYARMAPLCNIPKEQIPARIRELNLVEPFECGQIEPDAFFEKLASHLDLKTDYAEFCDIWSSIFRPDPLIPESMLERLKDSYRLLLLSNTNAIHFEMIEQNYPLLRHFDHKVLSYKVGAMKPSPAIYQEALRHAQCRPDECFFTDDIPAYVEGARAQGIDAVQFQDAAQLESELRRRGVII